VNVGVLDGVAPATEKILRRSRKIFGPRLVVARVASAVWQETVRRFAAASALVVIDISRPTESLLWEIETVRSDKHARWILVGEEDHLAELTTGNRQKLTAEQKGLLRLVDGEEVLAYSMEPSALRRFTRALAASLFTAQRSVKGGA
jgi:hypothetical protein